MKKSNGITLIALVITIIVLLILAGISISAISGENGIVSKAKEATEKTETAQQDELEVLENYETQIKESLLRKNSYGFYFNTEYVCYDYHNAGRKNDRTSVIFKDNNTIELNSFEAIDFKAGESYDVVDFAGMIYANITSLEYNKTYTGKGTFNTDCSCYVDTSGNLYTKIIFNSDIVNYLSNGVSVANNAMVINFSNDGKVYDFNGKEFKLEP